MLQNYEVAAIAKYLAGCRMVPGAYGVHLGRDGVYRSCGQVFEGDPVGALALNQHGKGSVSGTARAAVQRLLGRRLGPGFAVGVSAGFDGRPGVSSAQDYREGYGLGEALRRDLGSRAQMREAAAKRLAAKRSAAFREFLRDKSDLSHPASTNHVGLRLQTL